MRQRSLLDGSLWRVAACSCLSHEVPPDSSMPGRPIRCYSDPTSRILHATRPSAVAFCLLIQPYPSLASCAALLLWSLEPLEHTIREIGPSAAPFAVILRPMQLDCASVSTPCCHSSWFERALPGRVGIREERAQFARGAWCCSFTLGLAQVLTIVDGRTVPASGRMVEFAPSHG